jgi:hypothetical protein
MAIPSEIDHVDELPPSCGEEARWLVGFWLNTGMSQPAKQRSNWGRDERYRYSHFWGQKVRRRIASQLDGIRHWSIIEGDYSVAPELPGHYFIDPPYQRAGYAYRYNGIDRTALAQWCRSRQGFVQVCESIDADWLPFQAHSVIERHRRTQRGQFSAEALFECENQDILRTSPPGPRRTSAERPRPTPSRTPRKVPAPTAFESTFKTQCFPASVIG